MDRSTTTFGAVRLDDAGLVAFTPCGHWWVYPVHADPEQMHDLARFNLGIACGSASPPGRTRPAPGRARRPPG